MYMYVQMYIIMYGIINCMPVGQYSRACNCIRTYVHRLEVHTYSYKVTNIRIHMYAEPCVIRTYDTRLYAYIGNLVGVLLTYVRTYAITVLSHTHTIMLEVSSIHFVWNEKKLQFAMNLELLHIIKSMHVFTSTCTYIIMYTS